MTQLFDVVSARMNIIQHPKEIAWAVGRIQAHVKSPLKAFLEFGSFAGGSFAYLARRMADPNAILVAVDPQMHGAVFDIEAVEAIVGNKVIFLKKNSEDTAEDLASIFGERKIDLCHIDSVHVASQTERELSIVVPLMASPSVIMLHDIKPGFRSTEYHGYLGKHVKQLSTGDYFQNIKFQYSYEEKKVNGKGSDMGIGLLLL